MKKIFAVILTLALLCCGAVAESVDITGMWYADVMGMVLTMELKADGVYTLGAFGETEDGAYTFDGVNVVCDPDTDAGATFTYDAAANTLTGDAMGISMVFGRETIATYAPAAVNTAAVIEDFAGMWNAFLVDMDGIIVDPAAFGSVVLVDVTGFDVTMVMSSVDDEEPQIFTLAGTLNEGVLSTGLSSDGIELALNLAMLEDGNIALDMDMDGEGLTFYLAPYVGEVAE